MEKYFEFFNNVIYLDNIDSTNDYLKKGDFEDKAIVYTFNQTKGRGREQKSWVDFKNKNLAVSFLLKPKIIFNNNIWYIAAASLALIDIIEKSNIKDSWIKWPNDVYIKKEKIAGILAESVWQSNKTEKIIVGIGINVNCTIKELSILGNKATSFFIKTGIELNMQDFFYNYKNELSKWLSVLIFENNGIQTIKKNWLKYSKIFNKNVEWIIQDKKTAGKIVKIEDDGTLILRIKDKDQKITSGEIRIKE